MSTEYQLAYLRARESGFLSANGIWNADSVSGRRMSTIDPDVQHPKDINPSWTATAAAFQGHIDNIPISTGQPRVSWHSSSPKPRSPMPLRSSLKPTLERKESDDAESTTSSTVQKPTESNSCPPCYRLLEGNDRYGLTMQPFVQDSINDEGRKRDRRIPYLEGLRGIIGCQTLLWIFFRIFAPAIVVDRDLDGIYPAAFVTQSPHWQSLFRRIVTPFLCDGGLQMTMFIILTGRVALLTFLERREALTLAGPCFRRPIRLFLPVAMTLAIVTILSAKNGFRYTGFMSEHLHNQAAQAPQMFGSVIEYFNSLTTLFMAPTTEKTARAVAFIPPSGISWYLEVAFQQIYVLTIYAWVFPFVTLKYKVIGVVSMIALSAWVGRWSWFTLTGLAIGEFSVVYKQLVMPSQPNMRRLSVYGLRQNSRVVWIAPVAFTILGIFFKYFWANVLPLKAPYETVAHASMHLQGLNMDINPLSTAYPRYDNWLLCTGLLLLIELSPTSQRLLSWSPLTFLGRLSFSIALTSGTIMLSLGSLVYHHLYVTVHLTNPDTITFIMFLIFIPLCLVCAQIFSRLIDDTSLAFSRFAFKVSRT